MVVLLLFLFFLIVLFLRFPFRTWNISICIAKSEIGKASHHLDATFYPMFADDGYKYVCWR
jgi:hypothetical protein